MPGKCKSDSDDDDKLRVTNISSTCVSLEHSIARFGPRLMMFGFPAQYLSYDCPLLSYDRGVSSCLQSAFAPGYIKTGISWNIRFISDFGKFATSVPSKKALLNFSNYLNDPNDSNDPIDPIDPNDPNDPNDLNLE